MLTSIGKLREYGYECKRLKIEYFDVVMLSPNVRIIFDNFISTRRRRIEQARSIFRRYKVFVHREEYEKYSLYLGEERYRAAILHRRNLIEYRAKVTVFISRRASIVESARDNGDEVIHVGISYLSIYPSIAYIRLSLFQEYPSFAQIIFPREERERREEVDYFSPVRVSRSPSPILFLSIDRGMGITIEYRKKTASGGCRVRVHPSTMESREREMTKGAG